MINITFPDGSVREFESGITPLQIAESISSRLAQDILCASVNDQIVELNQPIMADSTIRLHKWEDPEAKHAFWMPVSNSYGQGFNRMSFQENECITNGYWIIDDKPDEEVDA